MEKMVPQNIEAECGVLGSIIIDPEAIVQVADFLVPEDFYRDAHRTIYETILHLYEQHEPADYITICDELEQQQKLKDVGGASYITSLINTVPTSGNVEFYGRIVERTAIQRRLYFSAGQIAAIAFEEQDADVALEKAEQLIFQLSKRRARADFASGVEIMQAYINKLEYLHEHRGALIGVPTGYRALDKVLGGLQKSDLIIAAGRPGMGKTSWALNIAYNALLQSNQSVAIISLEMNKEQLMQRLVSMDTGIDSTRLRSGWINDHEWDAIIQANERLSTERLHIDDTAGLSVGALRSKARRLQIEHPFDLLIIDYAQLLQATINGKRPENEVKELSEISATLKAIAMELNVPVLALAQLSRKVEERADKVPQLADLRGSGTFEQDADVVLFLYRDDYYAGTDEDGNSKSNRPNTADVIVAKHRNGPTGEVELYFDATRTRFFNNRQECEVAYGC